MFFTDSCFARANIDIREFPKLASNLLASLRLEKQTLELSAKQGFPRHIPHSPQHLKVRLSWMNHVKPLSLSASHLKKIFQQTQNKYYGNVQAYGCGDPGWMEERKSWCQMLLRTQCWSCWSVFLFWHWLMICHCHCHSWVRYFTFHFLGIPAVLISCIQILAYRGLTLRVVYDEYSRFQLQFFRDIKEANPGLPQNRLLDILNEQAWEKSSIIAVAFCLTLV